MLTGQCKTDFKSYVRENYWTLMNTGRFDLMPLSMQWGVFQDFFDYVDIDLDEHFKGELYLLNNLHQDDGNYRQKARISALKKADLIYNKR